MHWCVRHSPYEKIQQGFLWKATITSNGWSRKTSRAISMISAFYLKKVPNINKSENVHSGTWAKFYRDIWSDAGIVIYIQCAIPEKTGRITDDFAKVSFRNRRWNKITTEGSTTYIKSKKICYLDLKLHN